MISKADQTLLQEKGISEEKVAEQLKNFVTGFPYLKIETAAAVGQGILAPSDEEVKEYLTTWDEYCKSDKSVLKFVPASGAASRMFKDLFSFLSSDHDEPQSDFEKNFFANIEKFAFYKELDETCVKNNSATIKELLATDKYKTVVFNLLDSTGMNYGSLPKGLLKFHNYDDAKRTPVEEHFVEGALYAAMGSKVRLHFTVSPNHRSMFEKLVEQRRAYYEKLFNVEYEVTFSEQKQSTDTIAVDSDNNPFREDGKLLFRPGGHGALIENLNDIDADIIFINQVHILIKI